MDTWNAYRRTWWIRWPVVIVALFVGVPYLLNAMRYDDPAATGPGWSVEDGIQGTRPGADTCQAHTGAWLGLLPDLDCNPGGVDTAVTQDNLEDTVCRPGGYTASVRPPKEVTNEAKKVMMRAYGIPLSQMGEYKLDHLIPLSAGGSSSYANLWPMPKWLTSPGSEFMQTEKDRAEIFVHRALCRGEVDLQDVQREFARDWTKATDNLGLDGPGYGWTGEGEE